MNISTSILEINIKNLIYNFKVFKKIAKNRSVAATIKANAYGLGDKIIFKSLYKNGCNDFFVATLKEGIGLRKFGKFGNIYILNGLESNKISLFLKNNLIPIINTKKEINIIEKHNIKFGIHIDTGINRLGLNMDDINISLINNKNIKIVLSHLSSADEKYNNYNNFQYKKFLKIYKLFNNSKIIFSFANSMGSILSKKFHFDLLRPGISLYGGHFDTKLKKILKPVIRLKGKILQIKEIAKNEYIGYNQTFKTKKRMCVAVIGLGYADGISRRLSNKGHVYYNNLKLNILGRVSMDSITIDITKHKKKFQIGKYVYLINYKHDVDELAKVCDTIPNEILTSLSHRVDRNYEI